MVKNINNIIILLIFLMTNSCVSTTLDSKIDKLEEPTKEFIVNKDDKTSFVGEYNGEITNSDGTFYEYIYYDVIDRPSNGNIQILIDKNNIYNIHMNEVDFRKKNISNSKLFYNYYRSIYEINQEIGNNMHLIAYKDGNFGVYCQFVEQGSLIQNDVSLKYYNRNLPLGIFLRFGYIFTVPIDIVTSPIQLLLLFITFFRYPGLV